MLYCFHVSTKIILNISCPDLNVQNVVCSQLLSEFGCLPLGMPESTGEWHVDRERMNAILQLTDQVGPYLANGFFTEPFIGIQMNGNLLHENEYFEMLRDLRNRFKIIHLHLKSDVGRNANRRTALNYLYSQLLDQCPEADRTDFHRFGWRICEDISQIQSFLKGVMKGE